MKLALKERITINSILPQEGDFSTMTIKQDIIGKTSITQEEIKKFEVVSDEVGTRWNSEKDKGKEIAFTDLETKLIKESLEKLDKESKLTDESFSVYKKFNQS